MARPLQPSSPARSSTAVAARPHSPISIQRSGSAAATSICRPPEVYGWLALASQRPQGWRDESRRLRAEQHAFAGVTRVTRVAGDRVGRITELVVVVGDGDEWARSDRASRALPGPNEARDRAVDDELDGVWPFGRIGQIADRQGVNERCSLRMVHDEPPVRWSERGPPAVAPGSRRFSVRAAPAGPGGAESGEHEGASWSDETVGTRGPDAGRLRGRVAADRRARTSSRRAPGGLRSQLG